MVDVKNKPNSLLTTELLRDLLKNPVLELVGAFVLIESLQRFPSERPIIGSLQGTAMEAAIGQIILIQQLSPSLPYLVQGAGDLVGTVGKLAPMLAAL